MDSGRKSRTQERPQRESGRAPYGRKSGRRPKDPLPISSHPEADPLERHLVTESDLQAYERDERRSRAIVSINGEDVDQRTLERRRAA